MFLSNLSIKRPVFAAVMMLALVTLGIRAGAQHLRFVALVDGVSQWGQWRERTRGQPWRVKLGDLFYKSVAGPRARRILDSMARYPDSMLRFHAGSDPRVPDWYWQEQDRLLGRFAGALTREELTPVLGAPCRVARQKQVLTGTTQCFRTD